MDAAGAIRTATPSSDPHLWRALTVSVGRLGIILELTFKIVRNKAVRRNKQVRAAGRRLGAPMPLIQEHGSHILQGR